MLSASDIHQSANAILQKHGIEIAPMNEADPDAQVILQYKLIKDQFDILDAQTFLIAQEFLQEVLEQDENNKIVQTFLIMARLAKEEPTPSDTAMLEHLAKDIPASTGIHHFLADVYMWNDDMAKSIAELQTHILTTRDGTIINRLKREFDEIGLPETQLTEFTESCTTQNISIPGATGQTRLEF